MAPITNGISDSEYSCARMTIARMRQIAPVGTSEPMRATTRAGSGPLRTSLYPILLSIISMAARTMMNFAAMVMSCEKRL